MEMSWGARGTAIGTPGPAAGAGPGAATGASSASLAGARARIADQVRAAQDRAAQARDLRERVADVVGEATDPGRRLWVRVDSAGRLVDVRVSQDGLGIGAARLSELILRTAAAAHRVAAERVGALADEAFGPDSETAARVRDEALAAVPRPGGGRRGETVGAVPAGRGRPPRGAEGIVW